MYQRAEKRAELDEGRHGPFAHEFQHLLNGRAFLPSSPEPVGGIVDDLLSTFNTGLHPYPSDGNTLKQRWTLLRSLYTVACNNFENLGSQTLRQLPNLPGETTHCVICTAYLTTTGAWTLFFDTYLVIPEEKAGLTRSPARGPRFRQTPNLVPKDVGTTTCPTLHK